MDSTKVRDLMIWLAVVVAAVAVLGAAVFLARKYVQKAMKGRAESRGELTIEKLEEMYQSGQISREEFSSLRKAALGLGARAMERNLPVRPARQAPTGSTADGGNLPLPSEPETPKPGLTDRPPDVDDNEKNPPPGEPPAPQGDPQA